uniref:Transposase n=1 Tax=Chenopodium quinoa TaxID=63459 RepID=A0A803NA32_CHEQI
MDHNWMNYPRSSEDFKVALNSLDESFAKDAIGDQIFCLCKTCSRRFRHSRDDVYDHLIINGFVKGFKEWVLQREGYSFTNVSEGLNRDHEVESEPIEEARKFFHLVEEGKKELYPGCKLKSYVRNRSNLEESIAEGYMMEECLTFISRYLREGVNTRLERRCARNLSFNQHVDELSLFPKVGHPIRGKRKRKGKGFTLDFQSLKQAHRYIVFNCDNTTVERYIKKHQIWVNSQGRKRRWDSAQSHIRDFIDWFFEKVQREQVNGELFWLAKGLNPKARRMTKNGSNKPEIASKSIITPYEKVWSMTMEKNAQRFRELRLDKIAQQLLEKNKNFAKGKKNVNSNVDDPDYVPDKEDCDLEEFEMSKERERFPKKKGRGPSNLFDVHARKWEDRVTIYCNDKGQPIGPEKARKELTRFLGTIAHDYNWAPLTYTNWKKVPKKEKICEFVNSKYILPVEAKDWVMETLDQSWRGFKCRLKRDHYYMYDTYEERLKHPPERVPEAHYKTLLAYWGTTIAKQAMRELEASQDDQSGEYVKDPFDEVMGNARRGTELLQGLGANRKKRKDKGPGTSLILPEEVMKSIKSSVTADVQKDINAQIEEFAKEKEVHAAQVAAQEAEIERKTKDLESETLKLQEIRMDIENQQGNITLDAVISALAKLRQKDPSLTPEIIAKAIVSTTTNDP